MFDETFEEVQNKVKLRRLCKEHKSQVLTDIYVYYITMRMRQHSYAKNQELKKINKTEKKLSKLVITYSVIKLFSTYLVLTLINIILYMYNGLQCFFFRLLKLYNNRTY